MPRLFFAVWPDAAAAAALNRWAVTARALCGGRVIAAEAIHLTLAFLGETPQPRRAVAVRAARAVRADAHALPIESAVQWARRGIVWAGPRAIPAPLASLARDLAAALRDAGFTLEAREFLAHVTLLRDARRPAVLPPLPVLDWPVADFVLAQSTPAPGGSRYALVERFALDAVTRTG